MAARRPRRQQQRSVVFGTGVDLLHWLSESVRTSAGQTSDCDLDGTSGQSAVSCRNAQKRFQRLLDEYRQGGESRHGILPAPRYFLSTSLDYYLRRQTVKTRP